MKATIASKKNIAKDTLEVIFALSEPLEFKAGQYVNVYIDGLKHHFSIANSPADPKKLTIATRIRQTPFKQTLAKLNIGAEVEVDHVEGYFLLPKDEGKKLVYIAGGIGITPFMSHLIYIQENNLGFDVALFYSNKTKEQTAYLDILQKWDEEYGWFSLIATMTEDDNWQGERGRINGTMVQKYVSDYKNAIFYIAGPPAMVASMRDSLKKELSLPNDNILTENFTGY